MKRVILVSALLLLPSCNGIKSPSPNTVAPTIATVACILQQVSQCYAAKTPWVQCTASAAAACGSDVITITQVWDAHTRAETVEGFVPRAMHQ